MGKLRLCPSAVSEENGHRTGKEVSAEKLSERHRQDWLFFVINIESKTCRPDLPTKPKSLLPAH